MEEIQNAVTLVLRGIYNQEWKINYFSIISYERNGDNETRLFLNGHLNNGESILLVALPIESFERLYNDAKADIEHIESVTYKALDDIQQRHNYFEWSGTDITDYISIQWTYPVRIEFTPGKELPIEVKSEIEEKFRIFE